MQISTTPIQIYDILANIADVVPVFNDKEMFKSGMYALKDKGW